MITAILIVLGVACLGFIAWEITRGLGRLYHRPVELDQALTPPAAAQEQAAQCVEPRLDWMRAALPVAYGSNDPQLQALLRIAEALENPGQHKNKVFQKEAWLKLREDYRKECEDMARHWDKMLEDNLKLLDKKPKKGKKPQVSQGPLPKMSSHSYVQPDFKPNIDEP